jgi:hypothetical protein
MKRVSSKIWWYFFTTLEVQLLIFLLLLPIFIWWGIPYSKYAYLGNIIFLPFLWIFLGLSLVNVILEYFYIPNAWLIFLQNNIADFWIYILKWSHASWLWCIHTKMLIPCILLATLIFYLYTFKRYTHNFRMMLLIISIGLIGIGNYASTPSYGICSLTHKKKTLLVYKYHDTLHILDHGMLASLQNPRSWIEYTLLPLCCSKFGSYTIGSIMLYKPSKKARAIAHIIKQYSPHHSCTISQKEITTTINS